jgi:CheY-like chemotaxis protein
MDIRRVLLVEDDPAAVRLAVSALRDEPYRLLWATNGDDALRLAREHRPDVIILSWTLPEMNGDELASLLSRDPATADIPLVLLALEPWLFGPQARARASQVVDPTYICEELGPRVRDALGLPPSSETNPRELARLRDRSLWWEGESDADWRPAERLRLSLDSFPSPRRRPGRYPGTSALPRAHSSVSP